MAAVQKLHDLFHAFEADVDAAEELAAQLAAFPPLAMLSDRYSAMTQWDYPEEEAIRREIEGSQPAFEQDFQSGAGLFIGGEGRHGAF